MKPGFWLITVFLIRRAATASLHVSALTAYVESDWTAVYYDEASAASIARPLLLGNDGSAARGGVHAFAIGESSNNTLVETANVTPGRTKLVTTVYTPDGKGVMVTIAQTDSVIRAYHLPSLSQIQASDATYKALGDYSALCSWRSQAGNWYLFLFGKREVFQFSIQFENHEMTIQKVRSFLAGGEASSCAVSTKMSRLLYSFDDSITIHEMELTESLTEPVASSFDVENDITGLSVYSEINGTEWLLIAAKDEITLLNLRGNIFGSTLEIAGLENIKVQGISVLQAALGGYPAGVLAFAIKHDGGAGFGLASLEPLQEIGVALSTTYHPAINTSTGGGNPLCTACRGHGYCSKPGNRGLKADCSCSCFSGWEGNKCTEFYCQDVSRCSSHGTCAGPNLCECHDGWAGPSCSYKLVEPLYETDAHGVDGDDPAVWISPLSAADSRIITTTKSEQGAGFSVFDLQGRLIQTIEAAEPNNVDIIYGFDAGNRSIDLAYAACRGGDTLCMFEITPNGMLVDIAGGTQPVKNNYSVYGSCTYRSPQSGKQYLFVNSKTSEYLQYELGWSADAGELTTSLVRSFMAGDGGQVEGCVADEQASFLFLGEEPSALWRYDAEPDAGETPEGYKIAFVGDGTLQGDVEGVTLVYGKEIDQGFILVSTQGVSAYNVYELAEPHTYVMTFSTGENSSKDVDPVSNTDGITAVGTTMGPDFPGGLVVVHDDANQLPGGTTSEEASFKLFSLADILGDHVEEVDATWDPRASV